MRQIIFTIIVILITNLIHSQTPGYIDTNKLVGWWPFNGNANDESGKGNHGTVFGASLTTDKNGNINCAYNFDGINDYIECLDNFGLDGMQEMSLSFWTNGQKLATTGSIPGGRDLIPIISKWSGSGSNDSYLISIQNNSLAFNIASPSVSVAAITPHNLNTNQWHLITVTRDSSSIKIFIDTSLVASSIVTNNGISSSTPSLFFGNWYNHINSNYQTFKGKLDNIGLWHRPLSSTEIKNIFFECSPSYSYLNQTACNFFTWSQNGITYNSTGIYKDTVTNNRGCDSVISLNLIINSANSSSVNRTACDSFTWSQNGITYNSSGIYKDTITNSKGCDSVISLNLIINLSNTSSTNLTACNSFTWSQNGITYNSSGIYNDTLTNTNGCDSVIQLNLTILSAPIITNQPNNQTTYIGNSVQFQTSTSTNSENFQWQQNNGTGFTNISNFGIYSGANTSTLTISNVNSTIQQYGFRCIITDSLRCSDTTDTATLYISLTSLGQTYKEDIFILYPNPTSGYLKIETTIDYLSGKIINNLGKTVFEFKNEKNIRVDHLNSGNYFLQLNGKNGKLLLVKKLTKI